MSDTMLATTETSEPQAIHLKDYHLPPYLIDNIDLTFDLYEDHAQVTSRLHIRRNRHTDQESSELRLNGEDLTLTSIKLNGETLASSAFEVTDQHLIIHHPLEVLDLEVVTRLEPQKNTALSGLYRSLQTFCTQCEAEGFRRITYFIDRPDVLSRFTVTITADAVKYPVLLSNGNLIATGKLIDGRHFARWEDPFKKPCYLFALVAGDFELLEDHFVTQSSRDIALRIYVEKGYLDQAQHAMYSIKTAMRWDEVAYGREYDLDVFMIVAIGDFNMGAMENKGLNIFNTKYILAQPATASDDDYIHILSVVGHEYFHNWTGNRVTCRDWFQLSLKEGLTIFRDQSFLAETLATAVVRIRDVATLRVAQFAEDAGPLAHPVRPDTYIEINNFYTATVYEKGAEVLRMLKTILGAELFRKGMDLYFARHDGQAVTIEDYVQAMEDVSGIDLRQFRLWYSQAGTPIVSVTDEFDADKKRYTLHISQKTLPTPGQPIKQALHIPIRVGLQGMPETDTVLQLTKETQSFTFDNIAIKPIPSLLRDFSAPVKLEYPYSDSDLISLFKHDTDAFNRWEAGQTLALNVLMKMIQSKSLSLPKAWPDMLDYALTHGVGDNFLLAEMISLPSEKYIALHMEVIDVDAIHAAREFALTEIAKQLKSTLLACYQRNHDPSGQYVFGMEQVGKRQLKNACLAYLLQLPEFINLGVTQFKQSLRSNMTDTQAALVGLMNSDSPQGAQALADFYTTWQEDALVVDKWLAIQATSKLPGTLARVKKLLVHPAFNIKNPNKVYALLGAFFQRNASQFHAISGEGYVFLRECVQQLDKLNPQIAARMVNPLTAWKRYDKERQQLMRAQLELLLLDKKISTDLYELVTKGLR